MSSEPTSPKITTNQNQFLSSDDGDAVHPRLTETLDFDNEAWSKLLASLNATTQSDRPAQVSSVNKIAAIAIALILFTGCGSSALTGTDTAGTNSTANIATVTSATSTESYTASDSNGVTGNAEATQQTTTNQTKQDTQPDSGNAVAKETTPSTARKPETKSVVQTATAAQTLALIDLSKLAKLKEKQTLESGPTYVYYSAEGAIASADAFYKAELSSKGWKEIASVIPPTDNYVDRLFQKDGFVTRVSISVGSTQGELGVMLANLGNTDVRLLPKMADADTSGIDSSAANATHRTSKAIPEIVESLDKQLLAAGWQPYSEFYQSQIDVPHFRSLQYRKESVRITLGIAKNPQNPAEKTTVFYNSDYAIPFDVPTVDSTKKLKLDLTSGRAAFESDSSRDSVVGVVKHHADRFGWKISNAEDFASGKIHSLPIETQSEQYLVVRLVESQGKYSTEIERSTKPIATNAPEENAVAQNNQPESPEASNHNAELEKFQGEVESQVQSEIAKAIGSVKSLSSNGNMSLAELQAKADELSKSFGSEDSVNEDDANSSNGLPTKNPFDVTEDKVDPSKIDKSITKSSCKVKLGDKTIDLPYSASYVINHYGEPTKCLIFSEGPINLEKLKRMLLKEGEPVYAHEVCESFKAILDARVSGESTSINFGGDGSSISTNTPSIKSRVVYQSGKLIGQVKTTEPIELGGQNLEIDARVNQEVIKVDWSKRNSPEFNKLVADTSKEVLVPEGCNGFSSEGSKYSTKVEATISAPVKRVEEFYDENLSQQGWKAVTTSNSAGRAKRYQSNGKELALDVHGDDNTTSINLQIRDTGAAKADSMIPPTGKALLVLANLSEVDVDVTIGGKSYKIKPSEGGAPKDATRVAVDPGKSKVIFKSTSSAKPIEFETETTAGTTWGVIYDTSFQHAMRLF